MSNHSPSRRRREGRDAFDLYAAPELLCPYKDEWRRADWVEGWKLAEEEYYERLEAEYTDD